MKELADQIAVVSRERVRDELTRMLTEGHASRAFLLLDESGLLQFVLPEISAMHGVEQPPEFHPEGDVFVHTLSAAREPASALYANAGMGRVAARCWKARDISRCAGSNPI